MMLDDNASPILPFIDKQAVRELAATVTRDTDIPWFGQLMNAPPLLAWLLQVDYWLKASRWRACSHKGRLHQTALSLLTMAGCYYCLCRLVFLDVLRQRVQTVSFFRSPLTATVVFFRFG